MKIVCIGGGPCGLFFSLLMKQNNPSLDITVVERNKANDTYGWGVVLSDASMQTLRLQDPFTEQAIRNASNPWHDVAVEHKGQTVRACGHGFAGIGRVTLLNVLQQRCEALGVKLVFETHVESEDAYADADLIVASDGVNSLMRARYAEVFKPRMSQRHNRYIWLGTDKRFDALTFMFQKTAFGWMQAHVYTYDEGGSTFIVECPEDVWLAHGLDKADTSASLALCEQVFASNLKGARLVANAGHPRGAQWLNFEQLECAQWTHFNGKNHIVLLGDAAHTAHFSIGSGTKLALEDAIALAQQFRELSNETKNVPIALRRYEAQRRTDVERVQHAASNAMEWFEVCGKRYCDQFDPQQLMYSLLTRSQRISHSNLHERDPVGMCEFEIWFANRAGVEVPPRELPPPPMFTPFTVRGLTLKNRVVVSPMAQYSAVDGLVGDYHLVHLGARANGGAAMVFGEMTSVSAQGRITPGCPGLYAPEHTAAWKRIVDWIHTHTDAKFALQLGHAGAKGSTKRGWEGIDQPLEEGNWPLMAASAQQYIAGVSQTAQEMTLADMEMVKAQFVASTLAAAEAGVDWLELHCAHGYLLSSFISPLTNHRTDAYGGSLANRVRFPLEVFAAMADVWPEDRPMSVRISAHDWVEGGITPDDAVKIADAFKFAGADVIDCSSGQVSRLEKPAYGRMYQTPFSDRIRQEVGISTIAVGGISEADHVNSIIAAGRADLCAIGRPHLANPAWTLTEAARIGYTAMPWPAPYRSGHDPLDAQFKRAKERAAAAEKAREYAWLLLSNR